jgi:hypothetical protein
MEVRIEPRMPGLRNVPVKRYQIARPRFDPVATEAYVGSWQSQVVFDILQEKPRFLRPLSEEVGEVRLICGDDRLTDTGQSQTELFFPRSDKEGFTFGIRYRQSIGLDAYGWCYREGEMCLGNAPKGVFIDPSGFVVKEVETTYQVYAKSGSMVLRVGETRALRSWTNMPINADALR